MVQESGLGPVSYLIVEFPGNKMTGEGFPILIDLVDRGLIRVLDLKFLTKDSNGALHALELADIDHDGTFDFAAFEGVSSGVIDDSDVDEAGSVLEPNSSAALMIFENTWAKPFVEAIRRGGAQFVAAGYIPHDTLAASLDAAEATTA
jgi:Family of unknown function (DUF6325)